MFDESVMVLAIFTTATAAGERLEKKLGEKIFSRTFSLDPLTGV